MIPFNKPYISGNEMEYIKQAVESGKLSGNGLFSKKCHDFFTTKYGFKKCLLTSSCTDALEMAAILLDIKEGDEVIIPSYTFVSTPLAFVRQGAKIVFADSCSTNPNIDIDSIEALITEKTKAIVPVHYAGIACDMDKIMALANKYNLFVVEDAAQAIDSYFNNKPLGSIGHLGCFSFHETKNIIAGEGGMLAINDERFIKRSEIIWEKGTNRAEFFRGEVNKYGWVDVGSSFLPSELTAAYLFAQLENIDTIQAKRKAIWNTYYSGLKSLEEKKKIRFPFVPEFGTNNGHMFYILCSSMDERSALIKHLKQNDVLSVFHYISLHLSEYYKDKHDGRVLENCDSYSDKLLRLPFYYELEPKNLEYIIRLIREFYS